MLRRFCLSALAACFALAAGSAFAALPPEITLLPSEPLGLATLAYAQDATVDVGGLFGSARPYLEEGVAIIAAAIVGFLAYRLNAWLGVSIEARHREALQTALTNAAGLVLQRLGAAADRVKIDVRNPTIAEAANYVIKAAPDAAKRFGLGPEELRLKVLAKLPQVAASSVKPAEAPTSLRS